MYQLWRHHFYVSISKSPDTVGGILAKHYWMGTIGWPEIHSRTLGSYVTKSKETLPYPPSAQYLTLKFPHKFLNVYLKTIQLKKTNKTAKRKRKKRWRDKYHKSQVVSCFSRNEKFQIVASKYMVWKSYFKRCFGPVKAWPQFAQVTAWYRPVNNKFVFWWQFRRERDKLFS